MIDLIFLGIIPGTRIQVTFGTWLYSAGILLILAGCLYLLQQRRVVSRLRNYLALRLAIWQFSRQALPA